MVDNFSSCFEIVPRILKNGPKFTVKELTKLKNKARFGLSMANCPYTDYLIYKKPSRSKFMFLRLELSNDNNRTTPEWRLQVTILRDDKLRRII